ncbi:hypothetical protein Y695_02218 [Hydrogenophaga sp. T4]|nr:hypothetical protein Y695_02218 [Hydrogenophaga sp. T4]
MRATGESSAARMIEPSGRCTAVPTDCGVMASCAVGMTLRRICSTSSTWTRRPFSASPSSLAMLVTRPPPLPSAASTLPHSSRTISATSSTAKAWVVRANSVTIRMVRPRRGTQPTTAGRSITGMICPRMLATPSTWAGAFAMAVMVGMTRISRTLKTLMPNSSRRSVPGASPRRNSISSNLLLPVRLVRSSMSCNAVVM